MSLWIVDCYFTQFSGIDHNENQAQILGGDGWSLTCQVATELLNLPFWNWTQILYYVCTPLYMQKLHHFPNLLIVMIVFFSEWVDYFFKIQADYFFKIRVDYFLKIRIDNVFKKRVEYFFKRWVEYFFKRWVEFLQSTILDSILWINYLVTSFVL